DSRADAYLSDFGIAREFGETSTLTMNTPEGTLPYMSPEQLDLGRISPRSDVYSLGVLLFEMLTGKLPLGGQFILAIKQRQTHEQLEDPSTINPAIPTGVAAILRELTSLESAQRPETCSEPVKRLATLLGFTAPVEIAALPDSPVGVEIFSEPLADARID